MLRFVAPKLDKVVYSGGIVMFVSCAVVILHPKGRVRARALFMVCLPVAFLLRVTHNLRIHILRNLIRKTNRHLNNPPRLQTRQIPQNRIRTTPKD